MYDSITIPQLIDLWYFYIFNEPQLGNSRPDFPLWGCWSLSQQHLRVALNHRACAA